MPTQIKKQFALHPDYQRYAVPWEKCTDAAEGEEAVKARGQTYIPMLTGMDRNSGGDAEYRAYLKRASWFGATGRTISGLTGTVLRKPPKIEYPDEEILETIGSRDEPILGMLQSTINSLLTTGRVGHLVDAGKSAGEDDSPRPYITSYCAQDILNWHQEQLGGRLVTTLVVLKELVPEPVGEKIYERMGVDQWRVLRLGSAPAINAEQSADTKQLVLNDGFIKSNLEKPFYFQEVWRKEVDGNGTETGNLIIVDTITPRKKGGRLWEEIPFTFSNTTNHLPAVEKPPLLDLVNVNLSHFRNSADLEHGRHFTCLPTPYAFGFDPNQPPKIGASVAWISNEKDGKVGMLEFTGAGLGHLREGMEDKKKEMAVLGSRLLEDQKTGVEAAGAIKLRLTSDNSTLTNIAIVTSMTWKQLLDWVFEWMNTTESDSIEVQLNLDFNPKKLTGDDLKTLFLLLQNGGMSYETYFWNLQTGEMIPPGRTREEEEDAITEGRPESAALGGLGNELPATEPQPEPPEDPNS